jgi:hypothetical protein
MPSLSESGAGMDCSCRVTSLLRNRRNSSLSSACADRVSMPWGLRWLRFHLAFCQVSTRPVALGTACDIRAQIAACPLR